MGVAVRPGVCVDFRVGETLELELPRDGLDSGRISITLLSKSGQKARLQIKADDTVSIGRSVSKQEAPAL